MKIFPETDQEWVGLTVVLGMGTSSLMLLDEAMEVLNRGSLLLAFFKATKKFHMRYNGRCTELSWHKTRAYGLTIAGG